MSQYSPKNFQHLKGTPGFSDKALDIHFTLYEGYVKNTNKLIEELEKLLADGKSDTPEYAEMKRRFGWEFDGMRLHELYFSAMKNGGSELSKDSDLYKKIEVDFGSYSNWEKDFRAIGAMRGIGWAILYYDKIGDKLLNVWINEHNLGHLAGAVPLLPMDVFEHAFLIDYGTARAEYIEAFIKAVDWEEIVRTTDSHMISLRL